MLKQTEDHSKKNAACVLVGRKSFLKCTLITLLVIPVYNIFGG